jgi:hypothetical protein
VRPPANTHTGNDGGKTWRPANRRDLSTLAPLRALRARTPDPAWPQRAVGEGVVMQPPPIAVSGRTRHPGNCNVLDGSGTVQSEPIARIDVLCRKGRTAATGSLPMPIANSRGHQARGKFVSGRQSSDDDCRPSPVTDPIAASLSWARTAVSSGQWRTGRSSAASPAAACSDWFHRLSCWRSFWCC